MTEPQLAENGAAPNNGELAIVVAISSMSELLVSSLTSLKSTMTESFGADCHRTSKILEIHVAGQIVSIYLSTKWAGISP